jgi:hypothetical protein
VILSCFSCQYPLGTSLIFTYFMMEIFVNKKSTRSWHNLSSSISWLSFMLLYCNSIWLIFNGWIVKTTGCHAYRIISGLLGFFASIPSSIIRWTIWSRLVDIIDNQRFFFQSARRTKTSKYDRIIRWKEVQSRFRLTILFFRKTVFNDEAHFTVHIGQLLYINI